MCCNVRTVADALREFRKARGLTLVDVAVRLEPPMHWRTLQRWETQGVPVQRGEHRDSWLEQLSELYGVKLKAPNGRGA